MASYVLLKEITLNATASSVTFSSIPATGYDDLKIVYSARSTRTGTNYTDDVYISFNSSTSDLTTRAHYSSTAGPGGFSTSTGYAGYAVSNSAGSSFYGATTIYIPKYAAGTPKVWSTTGSAEANSSSGVYTTMQSGGWNINTAISNITLTPGNGSWVAGSTFSLYAIAGVGTTPPAVPFASGGDIVTNDGTYWYHAFLASGTFVPTKTINADVLVVAGGGSGGSTYNGGGGGAGGLRGLSSQTFLSSTSHVVTVGAGGTAVNNNFGNNGNNSSLIGGSLSISATGGGTGGWVYQSDPYTQYAGTAGGSGGGGQGSSLSGSAGGAGNAGGYTPVEGYAGGTGSNNQPPYYGSGGGGGAGAVGANGSSSGGGAGGVGSSAYSSWGSATSTGQNVSSTYYYAGGGGGAYYSAGGTSSGGYGGGGAGSNANGVAGTANTGGGGGGGERNGSNPTGGAGGSGIVIVRYPM